MVSQILIVPSNDPDMSRQPSRSNATPETASPWPTRVVTAMPVWRSQIFTVRSSLAVARRRLSGLNARPGTVAS